MARILVVDDDPDIRDVVCMALGDEGHELAEAINGAKALETIQTYNWQPNLIVLDLNMPVMNGWQFVPAYREQGGTAPILVLTAGRNVDESAAKVGAEGALYKPFDIIALLDAVDTLLARAVQPAV